MAKITGTADNYLDLMTDFRDFITGVSPTISWISVRDTSTSPVGANSPNTTEMIFEGDASNGGSPTRNLYFGIRSYEDPGAGVFGLELRGFTGFQDGSPAGSVAFEDQPDASPPTYIPLQNTAMDYWIWANERRIIMIVKTGTSYQWFHAGFLDPFATETEYPYPLMVCGSSHQDDIAFNSNAIRYSSMINPGGNDSEVPISINEAVMYVRFVDGQWYPIKNFRVSGSAESEFRDRGVWPLVGYDDGDWPESSNPSNPVRPWRDQFLATTAGGTPITQLAQTPGSPDDITPLYPLTILFNDPSVQLVGEISGAFWISSVGGITSEDEIFDSGVSPAQRYLAFQNIHRTDDWEFGAIKDE